MHVTKIFLKDFRNFSELNLNLGEGINIFLGRNAQGKTNILEAVYFASVLRSRAVKMTELISWGGDTAFIKIYFSKADISQDVALELTAGNKSRKLLVNGEEVRSKSFVGRLNAVMFSPEDLFLFKGAPAMRRQFLNAEISQASPAYYENLVNYNHVVTQRNNLLKKIRAGVNRRSNLATWDEQLAHYAAKITAERLIAVDTLNDFSQVIHKNISARNEKFSVEYSLKNLDFDLTAENFYSENFKATLLNWYKKIIAEKSDWDIESGNTGVGPHLDDLKFSIDDREIKTHASQGQLRTAALSLKLAELEFLKSACGEYPVLLLDDVMSELDAERREKLLNFLRLQKIQTIITATEKKYFPEQNFGKTFEVMDGKIL